MCVYDVQYAVVKFHEFQESRVKSESKYIYQVLVFKLKKSK